MRGKIIDPNEKLVGVHVKWGKQLMLPDEIILCSTDTRAEEMVQTLSGNDAVSEASVVIGTIEWSAKVD